MNDSATHHGLRRIAIARGSGGFIRPRTKRSGGASDYVRLKWLGEDAEAARPPVLWCSASALRRRAMAESPAMAIPRPLRARRRCRPRHSSCRCGGIRPSSRTLPGCRRRSPLKRRGYDRSSGKRDGLNDRRKQRRDGRIVRLCPQRPIRQPISRTTAPATPARQVPRGKARGSDRCSCGSPVRLASTCYSPCREVGPATSQYREAAERRQVWSVPPPRIADAVRPSCLASEFHCPQPCGVGDDADR